VATPAPLTFEDLAGLDDRSLQIVLRQIDHPTLVHALRGASAAVADAVFRNVSQRSGERLREDIAAAGELDTERVAAAHQAIADVLTAVYAREAIREHDTGRPRPSLLPDTGPPPAATPVVATPPSRPAPTAAPVPSPAAPPERPRMPTAAPSEPVPLQVDPTSPSRPPERRVLPMRDPAAVAARLVACTVLVRRGGPLALDGVDREIEATSSLGRHLRLGLQLVVDGENADRAQELLHKHTEKDAAALAAALDLLSEGILAIQAGSAPREFAEKFTARLTPLEAARLERIVEASPAEGWLDDPVVAISAMTAWCRAAHRSGLVALEPIGASLDAATDPGEHARVGLMLVVDGEVPELVRDVLDTNRDTIVGAFRQAAAMVDAGIWYIQNEQPPRGVADALAVFLAPHDRARFRTLASGNPSL
jgi:flagellar motor component MotA